MENLFKMTEKKGWFKRIKEGLVKSSSKLTDGLSSLITKRKLDQETLDDLETLLITTDMGIQVTEKLIAELRKQRFDQEITLTELQEFLATEIEKILLPIEQPMMFGKKHRPHVVMMVGVNGAGKTTTIGKMATDWKESGLAVSIAACDTFRAAATEQIHHWADQAGVPIISGTTGTDAAGLAYDAFMISKNRKDDILLIDTAGRLHNKSGLMDELEKITRVLKKIEPSAPHDCILILDATTGQNAYAQVEVFKEKINISGIIMTKLDGTARGGVVIGLAERFQLPLHAIGVGESSQDIYPFDAKIFTRGLLGLENIKESSEKYFNEESD